MKIATFTLRKQRLALVILLLAIAALLTIALLVLYRSLSEVDRELPRFRVITVDKVITSLCLAPDGSKLVTGHVDGSMTVWEWPTLEKSKTVSAHQGQVTCLAFSTDGATLISGALEEGMCVWDFKSQEVRGRIRNQGYTCAIALDGQTLIAGGGDFPKGRVSFFQLGTGEPFYVLEQFESRIRVVAMSPVRRTFAVRSDLGPIEEWDLRTKAKTQTLWEDSIGPSILSYAPDGQIVAIGSRILLKNTDTVVLFDPKQRRERVSVLAKPGYAISDLAWSPDSTLIAMVTNIKAQGGEVILFDVRGNRERYRETYRHHAYRTCFSQDGKFVVAASGRAATGGVILVWELDKILAHPNQER